MNKVELLAPAGNFNCLVSAINNGADAVYLGGKNFSARAFANNFDSNEIIEAINYAHLRNVKVYVTLNTLLNESEFNNAIKLVDFYYQNNVDALLIQDLGLYYYIKNKYPDFDLHSSTQMHVHNIDGIKNAKELGFSRVVIARESDIDFIKEACKQNIGIETFVHGAICVSYSGQCLMSSATKNRSANKGMCAQCCRLRYELYDSVKKIETNTNYLLSPKDLCLINDIPKLIDAGVKSFKIEGRLKSPAYVGYVTGLYRKAIDNYYDGIQYKITDEELNNLKVLFNRNFTNDYLYKKDDIFGQKTPNHLGIEIGETINYSNNNLYIKLYSPLNQFDGIRINDFGCIVNMLYKDGLLVSGGKKGDIVSIKTDNNYFGKVYKTLDYTLENTIMNTPNKKLPINIYVAAKINKQIEVSLSCDDVSFKYISKVFPQKAKNKPLNYDSFYKQFSKLNDTIYYLNDFQVDIDDVFLQISLLNEIRRDSIIEFNKYRLSLFKRKFIYSSLIYKPINIDNFNEIITNNVECKQDNNIFDINYVINSESKYSDSDNALICEFGGLLKEYKNKIAYYTLNCSNSYAYEFLKKLGFNSIILSSELGENDINKLVDSFYSRNSIKIHPFVLTNGNRALMYLKANPFKGHDFNNLFLSDGSNKYSINSVNNYIEIIENNSNSTNQVFSAIK